MGGPKEVAEARVERSSSRNLRSDPLVAGSSIHNARRILAYLVKIASRVLEPTW